MLLIFKGRMLLKDAIKFVLQHIHPFIKTRKIFLTNDTFSKTSNSYSFPIPKIKIRLIEKLHSPAPRQNKSIEHYQEASITLYGIPLKFVSPFRSRCIETSIEPGGHGVRPLAMESKRNKRTKNKKERAAAAASPGEILGRSSTALCFVLREIATSPVGRANQLDIYDRGWPVAAASAAPWPRFFAATAG